MTQMKNRARGVLIVCLFVFISLACLEGAGIPNLFATATPTSTPTVTPSPAPSPTATATVTPTPLPTGVVTVGKSNGETIVMDYDNSFELTLPRGWIVIPVSGEDLVEKLDLFAEENPDIGKVVDAFKQLDSDAMRVIAMNEDPKYIANGFATNLNVTAIEDRVMSSMPMPFVMGTFEQMLSDSGSKMLSPDNNVRTNPNGVEVGIIDFQQASPTATGTTVQIRLNTIVFQSGDKLVLVQLGTPVQFVEDLWPVIDQVADSIKLLEQ